MPQKKNKSTTRVGSGGLSRKKSWFKPWYAIVGIVLIVIIGIVVVRFSQASSTVWKQAASFQYNRAYYTTQTYKGKNPAVPATASVWTMQSSSAVPWQIYGPYLYLPYSNYIDVCFLVNTTRYDTRVKFDVSAWEGQKILFDQDTSLGSEYVNKTFPIFVYPGKCFYNIPIGNFRSGVEFRARVLYGDMKFAGVTYRQH